MDDFLIRAGVAAVGVALVAGPLGCFVIWRRLSYFGDTLAHGALLGVALSFLLGLAPVAIVFLVCAFIALALFALQRDGALASDAILGILSHGSLALGMVAIGAMSWLRVDLTGLLFGDILAVNMNDILTIWIGGAVCLAVLVLIWNRLFAATVNGDIAAAEGQQPERITLVFMLLVAGVIAIAMKVVGVLLITALLIVPAATSRRLAHTPEAMAVVASLLGAASAVLGLWASLQWDVQAGPAIVVAALVLFVGSLAIPQR
ncbi:metal ABC transporter permease [Ahrensia sp. R2A130]|uniref:metal ABC transporter permease n=1 Tax=Ahrensia sp. R2A130 TaxID=744979 RepID=UPI0001E0B51A|nr:metal ABC transporter permease [Ahrensia sp. R2A130]EFL87774.1 high-affinity zinc uptake system membrane ABC transporter protein [Ahrensia sp. R2A130]